MVSSLGFCFAEKFNMSLNNNVNTIPIFASANFHTWQQQVGDFLKYQRLWRHATRPAGTTPADLQAQATWDEVDEQAQGILGLCLFPNLYIHLSATAAISWMNLDNQFRQPGIGSIYADLQAALHMKILGGQNPQVEMQQMLTPL